MWFFCQAIQADGLLRWRLFRSPSLYHCLRMLLQRRCFPKRLLCLQNVFCFRLQQVSTTNAQWFAFFQELHARLHSGMSLIVALKHFPRNVLSREQQMLVMHALYRLQQGYYIYPLFQPFITTLGVSIVQLLHISEMKGYFKQGIQQVQSLLGMKIQVQQKIRHALIYPVCLFGMLGTFGVIVYTFLLPRFEEFLYQQSITIHPVMKILLQLNHHMEMLAFVFSAGTAIAVFLIRKKNISVVLFFLRKIGYRWYQYHLFALNFSTLLANRFPLLKSLQMAMEDLSGKEFLFQPVYQRIMEGAMVAQALEGFPDDFRQSLAAAEIRGDWGQTLQQWSQRYYQRYEACWMQVCKWVEPVCITGIAILILGGMLIVFLPVLQTFLSMNGNLG